MGFVFHKHLAQIWRENFNSSWAGSDQRCKQNEQTAAPFCQEQVSVHHPQETALPNSKLLHHPGVQTLLLPTCPCHPTTFRIFFLTTVKITALFQNIPTAFITLNPSQHIHTGALITTLTLLDFLVPLWIVMNIYAHFQAVPPGLHRAQVVSAAEAFH